MRKIQILGPGCPKCVRLHANACEAAQVSEEETEVVKVSGIAEIMGFGVMITPALALDGKVISTGKVLTAEEIRCLLAKS